MLPVFSLQSSFFQFNPPLQKKKKNIQLSSNLVLKISDFFFILKNDAQSTFNSGSCKTKTKSDMQKKIELVGVFCG
jgi:hypothetical protein